MQDYELDGSSELRLKVLKGISIGIGSLSAVLAVGNALNTDNYIFPILQALYALYSLYLYLQIKNRTLHPSHKYFISAFLTLLVVGGTWIRVTNHGLFIWTLVLPIVYYLLLGRKAGLIATVMLFVVQLVNVDFQFNQDQYFYQLPLMVNLGFSYISIAAIAHVYESNRHNSEQKLTKLATIDPLTQTNNRLALQHRFAELEGRSKPFHLMMLDIDHFKSINDDYGHDAGDLVLKSLTQLLESVVGKDNVYRHGGEEFCIVLEDCSKFQAVTIADNIRVSVDKMRVSFRQKILNVTVSIGVAQSDDASSIDALNRMADDNLYKAKNDGRNAVVSC